MGGFGRALLPWAAGIALVSATPALGAAPSVSNTFASSTSATTARVSAAIVVGGKSTTYRVDYALQASQWCTSEGQDGAPAHSQAAAQSLPADHDPWDYPEVDITGLTAGATYCAELVASNSDGTGRGGTVTFIQGLPVAFTDAVESEAASTAVVSGSVNPTGQATSYYAEYVPASAGPCGGPPTATAPQALRRSSGWQYARVALEGLATGTEYCARLRATNASGTSPPGSWERFTPGLPHASMYAIRTTGSTTARVRGAVGTRGLQTSFRFAHALSSSDWCKTGGETGLPAATTAPQDITEDNGELNPVSAEIDGLAAGSIYCAALIATNSAGTDVSFYSSFWPYTHGAPRVGGNAADSSGPSTTVVRGLVDPAGLTTTYRVAYDLETSDYCGSFPFAGGVAPANTTAPQTLATTVPGFHPVEVTLTGLAPGTAYCALIVAENSAGTSRWLAASFVQGAPKTWLDDVSPSGPASALVQGTVDPLGQATSYRVDYDVVGSSFCGGGIGPSGPAARSTTPRSLPFEDRSAHPVTVELGGLTPGEEYCAELVAVNGSGSGRSFSYWFPVGNPRVADMRVRSTGAGAARVTATVNPAGQQTAYHLEYAQGEFPFCGLAGSADDAERTPVRTLPQTSAEEHEVTFDLSGLEPGASYCVLVVAENATGSSSGLRSAWPLEFEQGMPSASITDVTPASATSAALSALVGPAGQATTVRALWDRADSDWCTYGAVDATHRSDPQAVAAVDGGEHEASVQLTDLEEDTEYCVEVEASNATGTQTSWRTSFSTTPGAPVISTAKAVASGTSATLRGTVVANGSATTYRFEYGTTEAYGSSAPPGSTGSGTQPRKVAATLSELRPGTVYHWRLVAENALGTIVTADQTFTTAGAAPATGTSPPATAAPVADAPTTGSGTPPAVAADRTAPRAFASLRSATRRALVLKRGVPVELTCFEACDARIELVLPARLAKRLGLPRVVGTARRRDLTAGRSVRLTARLSTRAKRRLAQAGPFRMSVVVTTVDAAGNAGTTTKPVLVSP